MVDFVWDEYGRATCEGNKEICQVVFPSKSYELFVSEFQQILLLQVATFCYFLGRLSPAQRAMALDAKDYEIQRVYWWTFGWKFTGGRFSLPCVGSAREPWSENTGHTGHTAANVIFLMYRYRAAKKIISSLEKRFPFGKDQKTKQMSSVPRPGFMAAKHQWYTKMCIQMPVKRLRRREWLEKCTEVQHDQRGRRIWFAEFLRKVFLWNKKTQVSNQVDRNKKASDSCCQLLSWLSILLDVLKFLIFALRIIL